MVVRKNENKLPTSYAIEDSYKRALDANNLSIKLAIDIVINDFSANKSISEAFANAWNILQSGNPEAIAVLGIIGLGGLTALLEDPPDWHSMVGLENDRQVHDSDITANLSADEALNLFLDAGAQGLAIYSAKALDRVREIFNSLGLNIDATVPPHRELTDELLEGTESETQSIDIIDGSNSPTHDEKSSRGSIFYNDADRASGGEVGALASIAKEFDGQITDVEIRSRDYGRDTAVPEQIDLLTDPSKAANAGGLVGKVSPGLSSPLENSERLFGERRSVAGQSSRVPRYQAGMDELTTSKPTPRERSYPWPDKPIRNIADAGAFIFEILNSPTPAQLRKKQKPVVYLKFPTSHQGSGEAGDQTEALMRLMMPAKKKNQTPFPVPLEEIARVLLQPRP